jgi:polyisoprenoid-binding protein YceI
MKVLIALALLTSTIAFAAPISYKVDSTSKVKWLAKKVAGQHDGLVNVKGGNLEFDGKELKSGKIEVDMTTITNTDLTDAEYNKKLVDHLKSEDFFSTEKNKTATLTIKSVLPAKGGLVNVVGDLTIKGITKPVIFDAKVTETKGKIKATADVVFDRTDYDIKYKSLKFFSDIADKAIEDKVMLSISLTAKK